MSEMILVKTMEELWELLNRTPEARVMAGGTDLMVGIREGKYHPSLLVGLERIEVLQQISQEEGYTIIGAAATHQQIIDNPFIQKHLPVLCKAISVLGSPPIRHMASLGGNICTASPAGDTLPPLYVLGAEVELISQISSRRMPISEFIIGPGRTTLKPGEVLSRVWIPDPEEGEYQAYYKVGQRKALAISIVSLAVRLNLEDDKMIRSAALAWGSVGPTVMTLPSVEVRLRGQKLTSELLHEIGEIVQAELTPISDIRASADYRSKVAANLLLRLLALCQGTPV